MTVPPPPHSQKKLDAGRIPGPVDNVPAWEILLIWQITATGRQYHTTLNGGYTGTSPAVTVANANTIQSGIFSSYTTNIASFQPSDRTLQALWIRDMSSHTNPYVLATGAAVPGTSASIAMPENAAVVLTENVNVRGKGAKGRLYIPNWATNADAGGGVIAAAVQTGLNAWGTAIVSAIQGVTGLTAAVAKPARQAYIGVTGTSHPARAAGWSQVLSYTCRDLVWDTQRRRVQL
jgi:hypothetical protein